MNITIQVLTNRRFDMNLIQNAGICKYPLKIRVVYKIK